MLLLFDATELSRVCWEQSVLTLALLDNTCSGIRGLAFFNAIPPATRIELQLAAGGYNLVTQTRRDNAAWPRAATLPLSHSVINSHREKETVEQTKHCRRITSPQLQRSGSRLRIQTRRTRPHPPSHRDHIHKLFHDRLVNHLYDKNANSIPS